MTATRCKRCSQKLLLLAPGRDVCERCRMGRTASPETASVEQAVALELEPTPCAGCGRTTVEGHETLRLALADGYCLRCRVDSHHLADHAAHPSGR